MSLNKAMIIGNLGQNPELKTLPSGQAVCTLSVATNEKWTDKQGQKQEHTEWHRVTVWGKTAENCAQYLTKGRQVFVEGKLQTRKWQDKEGKDRYTTEIQAHTVQFIGGQGNGGDRPPHPGEGGAGAPPAAGGAGAPGPQTGAPPAGGQTFTEDDIPF